MKHPATVRQPGEGRRLAIVGDVYRFLATGDETDGKYCSFEAVVPPGSGPPPHVHTREEESFLVLEGEMTFQLGEDRIVAGQGTFLNMPVGSLHCFKNESDTTARLLITVAPAGLENMFFEVGLPLADDVETAPPPSRADIDKLLQVAPRYGIEIKIPAIEDGIRMRRVLVLCTGNSCRSQMAEALWESLGEGEWESESAGSKPSGYVHPLAIRAMRELGIDIASKGSKSLDRFRDQHFDLVVTVCDNAKESCPVFPGATTMLHWPFDDPAEATGTEEEQMVFFRRVRDEIKDRIQSYLATFRSGQH